MRDTVLEWDERELKQANLYKLSMQNICVKVNPFCVKNPHINPQTSSQTANRKLLASIYTLRHRPTSVSNSTTSKL